MKAFADVVMEAFENKELVQHWERLYGMKLSTWRPPRNGLEAIVDKATGANPTIDEEAARAFVRFVWEYVWTRLPPECFAFVESEG